MTYFWLSTVRAERSESEVKARRCSGPVLPLLLNQTSRDRHTRVVTLNEVKGLSERFFAALRMTWLGGCIVRCMNVMRSGLTFFCVAIVTAPHPALACAVCFVSKKENLMAFFGTGVLLSLLPFILIGAVALWLYRQVKTQPHVTSLKQTTKH